LLFEKEKKKPMVSRREQVRKGKPEASKKKAKRTTKRVVKKGDVKDG